MQMLYVSLYPSTLCPVLFLSLMLSLVYSSLSFSLGGNSIGRIYKRDIFFLPSMMFK